ncbi:MAG TPA: RidA family protein [Pseudohongiella sp.]|nr:RidA family protein [Pseudohongiella sp.]
MEIQRIHPAKRWSDMTVYNGIAHFVEVPDTDLTADIKGQTQQILEQAEKSLAEIGSDKTRLLSATIYITDLANLAGMNEVWDKWLEDGTAPSRACVKVELVDPRYLVEIAFVAAC